MNSKSQKRHENRLKTLFPTLIILLSSAHFNYAQEVTSPSLRVISNAKAYQKSISDDSLKRMVALSPYITPLFSDLKYASANNFTHRILYHDSVLFARLEVAKALQKVQAEFARQGLSLTFFDTYRPYSVTKTMWKIVPDERYAANPAKGSSHNRGAAVDVSLVKISTGEPLPMPTPFDDFTQKAHHNYMNLDKAVIENRALLRRTMEKYGFVALETEWWHYSFPNAAQKYEILDLSFRKLKKLTAR